jgi:hypothetical protein
VSEKGATGAPRERARSKKVVDGPFVATKVLTPTSADAAPKRALDALVDLGLGAVSNPSDPRPGRPGNRKSSRRSLAGAAAGRERTLTSSAARAKGA